MSNTWYRGSRRAIRLDHDLPASLFASDRAQALLDGLRELNARTYGGGAAELDRWGKEMPEGADQTFEPKAKQACRSCCG